MCGSATSSDLSQANTPEAAKRLVDKSVIKRYCITLQHWTKYDQNYWSYNLHSNMPPQKRKKVMMSIANVMLNILEEMMHMAYVLSG